MARYVIDAPTLLHLIAGDFAVDPRHQLVAPSLIRSQALTLLLQSVRRGELSEAAALRAQGRMAELKIRLLGDRMSRRTAWNIALASGWETTYDAEYLAVTRLQADALVTVDPALAALAAGARTGGSPRGAHRYRAVTSCPDRRPEPAVTASR